MENTLQIQEKIKQFILKTSYVSSDQVNYDTLIFQQGIMDSMGFISIIDFIEESFSITAADNDLLEANFESINAIADFVSRKLPKAVNQTA
ncbi:MAG: acyl carrier protein [Bacteroidota bacterium]|nr:acyl carrier protein [Bacteroidota bacterium]